MLTRMGCSGYVLGRGLFGFFRPSILNDVECLAFGRIYAFDEEVKNVEEIHGLRFIRAY